MLIPLTFPATFQTKSNQTTLKSILISLVHVPPTHPHVSNSYKAQHNTIPIPLILQIVLSLNCRFFGGMPSAQSHSVSE